MEIDPGHVPSTQRHGAGEPRWERTRTDLKSGSCKVSTKVSMLSLVLAKRSISHRGLKWESRSGNLTLGSTISLSAGEDETAVYSLRLHGHFGDFY